MKRTKLSGDDPVNTASKCHHQCVGKGSELLEDEPSISANLSMVVERDSQVPRDSTLLWDIILSIILSTLWFGSVLVVQILIWTARLLLVLTSLAGRNAFQLVMRIKAAGHSARTKPTSAVTSCNNTSRHLSSGFVRSMLVKDLLKKKKSQRTSQVQQAEAEETSISTETSTSTQSSDVASDCEGSAETSQETIPRDTRLHNDLHTTLTKRNRSLVVPSIVGSRSSRRATTPTMSSESSPRSLGCHSKHHPSQQPQQQYEPEDQQVAVPHQAILRRQTLRGSSLLERVTSTSARWMASSSSPVTSLAPNVRSLPMPRGVALSSTRLSRRRSSRLSSSCQEFLKQTDERPEAHQGYDSSSTPPVCWDNPPPTNSSSNNDDGRPVPWISTTSSSVGSPPSERHQPHCSLGMGHASPAACIMEIVVFTHDETPTTHTVASRRQLQSR